ncbi:TylF/MycF/NovP-related O-methyltransferase [Nocardia bhagyanarayanae]|uniref:O-methyltransferase n=1 Tax=Nocardia bhagyanarayanae TaxID=1215925 RepID=A0A543FH44_9NOCA|nr:TylF/MycF/NovP-related O-methyltransferase [Nocardia bhagyanarayanae]TQM33183.1 O-methyltransferase [Nocardia bhagyanarayanae]
MHDRRGALQEYLLRTQPRTVDRGRMTIVERELVGVVRAGVAGAVVEFGCYRGGMTAWLRAVLDSVGADPPVHAYDSFRGLPAPGRHDSAYLAEGEFAASVGEVVTLHERFGLRRPHVHAGWFAHTVPEQLPARIAFAYLDGDRYESTLLCLRACLPRLAPGAVLVFDDYADPASPPDRAVAQPKAPGVMKACEEVFGTPLAVSVVSADPTWTLGVYRHAIPPTVSTAAVTSETVR